MGLCLIGMTFSQLVSPIAVNRILAYLESSNPNFLMRPWFWVFVLFIGPIIASLFFQWYIFVGTRTLARVQAILTELIFEHGLRIRLKAEASGESSSSPGTGTQTPVEGHSSASTVVDNRSPNPSAATSAEGVDTESSDVAKGKAKAEPAKKETPLQQPKKKDNLVGKINTLVTVDVDRIAESKDFLMILLLVPLELTTSMIFLYVVLGWR
jgi:ABC-type multidrug transport system fused ATPase/permease subunit